MSPSRGGPQLEDRSLFEELVARCARNSFRMGQLLTHCAVPNQVYQSSLDPRFVVDSVPAGMQIPGLMRKLNDIVKDQALRVRTLAPTTSLCTRDLCDTIDGERSRQLEGAEMGVAPLCGVGGISRAFSLGRHFWAFAVSALSAVGNEELRHGSEVRLRRSAASTAQGPAQTRAGERCRLCIGL